MPVEEAQREHWSAMLRHKQEDAVLKALSIDDTLAEAHVALAAISRDGSAAEKELKYALELNPNCAVAHWTYGSHLDALGRFDEAIEELKQVLELDPVSVNANAAMGMPFYFARRYDEAIEQFKKTIEMDPNFAPAHLRLAMAYAQKGMYKEAIAEASEARALDNAPQRWGRFASLAYIYAVSGNRYEARKMLNELKELAKKRYIPPGNFALIYIGLGEKDEAFACLENSFVNHSIYPFIKVDPMYDSLRSDPRFTNLLRRMNLAS
jgi:tetratricopeptide (TPR) repeat protein